MMSLLNNLKKVLGCFWLLLWLDAWLITNILKLNCYLTGARIKSFINSIYKRTDIGSDYLSLLLIPNRLLLDILSIKNGSYSFKLKLGIQLSTLSFSLKNPDTQSISIVGNYKNYSNIRNFVLPKLSDYNTSIINGVDFSIYNGSLTIHNKKKFLLNLNLKKVVAKSDLLLQCYLAWGILKPDKDILDKYCTVLQLPLLWSVLYPTVVKTAFKAHFLGLSLLDIKYMLGLITGYPVCLLSGLVTDISNDSITIASKVYRSKFKPAVSVGLFVLLGQSLFKSLADLVYPLVLTYKDDLTTVPVLNILSSVGVISIPNTLLIVLKANTLPIANLLYQAACASANLDNNIPQISLNVGMSINPLLFLVKKIWKKRFCLLKIYDQKSKDLDILISFILRNIPKSSFVFVQPQDVVLCELLLDLQKGLQVILYYKDNNVYLLEVTLDSL